MAGAIKIVLGIVLGAAGGYGISRLLCLGGGCPITSNRPLMTVVGAIFGLVAALMARAKVPARELVHFGIELTTPAEFKAQVIDPGRPALVDFYSTTCGPCRQLAPVLADLEKQYEGKVAFFRVDVRRAAGLADEHRIRRLPTLEFYRDGERVDWVVGALGREALIKQLDGLLAERPAG